MSVTVRCDCGKDNLVDAGLIEADVWCIRCSRPLPKPKPAPAANDPYGLIVPEAAPAGRAAHPAAHLEPAEHASSAREYLYWLLPIALLPLAVALGHPTDDTEARFRRTLHESPPSIRHRIEQLEHSPFATIDDVFDLLPDRRIVGALLPHGSARHWLFAGVSIAAFLVIALATFPNGGTTAKTLCAIGFFTGTAGVMLLLIVQPFFTLTVHDVLDDNRNFVISLFGYIFGVGLFEELAKLVPLLWRYRRIGPLRWRAACLWGLASGAGFGVAEGVFYSESMYNGLALPEMYFVRFFSCVALHAIWTASAALSLARYPHEISNPTDKAVAALSLLRILAIPTVLHGLYDAVLQYNYDEAALGVALVSFGWLAWQIEATRAACMPHVEDKELVGA